MPGALGYQPARRRDDEPEPRRGMTDSEVTTDPRTQHGQPDTEGEQLAEPGSPDSITG